MNPFLKTPLNQSRHHAMGQWQSGPACNRTEQDDECYSLARLLGVWPAECADARCDAGRILRLLIQALRRERALGRAGRRAYSLTRHIDLARACNQARLAAKQKNARSDSGRAFTFRSEGVHAKVIADSSAAAVQGPN